MQPVRSTTVSATTLVNVPPQEARSVEIGTKWELFNKRLLATAAMFQTTSITRERTRVTATDPRMLSRASTASRASS